MHTAGRLCARILLISYLNTEDFVHRCEVEQRVSMQANLIKCWACPREPDVLCGPPQCMIWPIFWICCNEKWEDEIHSVSRDFEHAFYTLNLMRWMDFMTQIHWLLFMWDFYLLKVEAKNCWVVKCAKEARRALRQVPSCRKIKTIQTLRYQNWCDLESGNFFFLSHSSFSSEPNSRCL